MKHVYRVAVSHVVSVGSRTAREFDEGGPEGSTGAIESTVVRASGRYI